jgi:hypothetical protein
MKTYDNYEISPCTRTEEPDRPGHFYFEVCEPHDANVWTLYGHINGEGAQAIGDFDTREHAEEAFRRITGIPFSGTREVQDRLRVMHAGPKLLEALEGLLSERLRPDPDLPLTERDVLRIQAAEKKARTVIASATGRAA